MATFLQLVILIGNMAGDYMMITLFTFTKKLLMVLSATLFLVLVVIFETNLKGMANV